MNSLKCNADKIGICRDVNINGLLHKAGLGKYVVDLDDLEMFKNTSNKVPSNKDLQVFMKSYPQKYTICGIHDRLKSEDIPICAKVKAEFLADYCMKYKADVEETMSSILNLEEI